MKGKGHLKPDVIDAYFNTWIKNRSINNDTEHGHITLVSFLLYLYKQKLISFISNMKTVMQQS